MSFDRKFSHNNPFVEFGRAAAAGLGFDIDPVSTTAPTMSRAVTPRRQKRLRYATEKPGQAPSGFPETFMPTSGASYMTRTKYHSGLGLPKNAITKRRWTHGTDPGSVDLNIPDKALQSFRLVNIPYGANSSQLQTRNSQYAFVKGVKFRCWWQLKSSVQLTTPIDIRWAIINPQENNGAQFPAEPPNWWVSNSPNTESSEDFVPTGTWIDFHTRGLNKREWGVMQSGNFSLQQSLFQKGTVPYDRGIGNMRYIEVNVPIHKQMKWASVGTAAEDRWPEQNLYFVWWYTDKADFQTVRNHASDLPLTTFHRTTTYFERAKITD